MKMRPTIPDLARASGVSVSTVNRVINQAGSVRQATREHVLGVARKIGFYGIRSIEQSVHTGRDRHRLGTLLQQGNRPFYRNLGEALEQAASRYKDAVVDLQVRFLDDLSPDKVARNLMELAGECESVALVAAQHPTVAEAIDVLLEDDIPLTALISPLSARGNVGFVGLDNWKVGRTAAWAFNHIVRDPAKIGILLGNHRYRNQELNEIGFRSYFREFNTGFTLLEPQQTYESAAVAYELTEAMLDQHPDLCGLYVSGGGITGAIAGLRNCDHRDDFVAVGYEIFDLTREALIDGTLTMVISHPMRVLAERAISAMINARNATLGKGSMNMTLNFEIFTSENV